MNDLSNIHPHKTRGKTLEDLEAWFAGEAQPNLDDGVLVRVKARVAGELAAANAAQAGQAHSTDSAMTRAKAAARRELRTRHAAKKSSKTGLRRHHAPVALSAAALLLFVAGIRFWAHVAPDKEAAIPASGAFERLDGFVEAAEEDPPAVFVELGEIGSRLADLEAQFVEMSLDADRQDDSLDDIGSDLDRLLESSNDLLQTM